MAEAKPEGQKTLAKLMNDFGKRFSTRSSPSELVNKGILREADTQNAVAPAILQQRLSLEDAKKKDQLNRRLSLRPSASDLKMRNILKDGDEKEQEKTESDQGSFETRQNQLKSILKKRPNKEQLTQSNILKSGDVDPSLAEKQERLRRSFLEQTLDDKLRDRPSPNELEEARILVFSETVEVLPTFRKSEYNRKPDNTATFKNLTPQLKGQIREELNSYKRSEMPVHEDSTSNTCFH